MTHSWLHEQTHFWHWVCTCLTVCWYYAWQTTPIMGIWTHPNLTPLSWIWPILIWSPYTHQSLQVAGCPDELMSPGAAEDTWPSGADVWTPGGRLCGCSQTRSGASRQSVGRNWVDFVAEISLIKIFFLGHDNLAETFSSFRQPLSSRHLPKVLRNTASSALWLCCHHCSFVA